MVWVYGGGFMRWVYEVGYEVEKVVSFFTDFVLHFVLYFVLYFGHILESSVW